jgi:dienelactone hydrolase
MSRRRIDSCRPGIRLHGAVHGFSNPNNNDSVHGIVYDKKADQRSWKAMQDFFDETFAK